MLEKNDDKNYGYVAAHLTTLDRIKSILMGLKEEGIEAMLLKGLYLAVKIYDDLGRPPGSDIDLLVRRRDALKAQDVLNRLGWRAGDDVLPGLLSSGSVSPLNSLMFFGRNDFLSVHLHWHVINSSWPLNSYVEKISMEDVWAEAREGVFEGVTLKELRPEHLVIYLCHHGFNHFFSKPVYAQDVKVALDHFDGHIDWDCLYAQAQNWGMRWIVDDCMKFIKGERPGGYDDIYWRYVRHESGLRRKAMFLGRTLFPQRKVLAVLYGLPPAKIGFGYYFRRWASR
jgi:hypothetical protein